MEGKLVNQELTVEGEVLQYIQDVNRTQRSTVAPCQNPVTSPAVLDFLKCHIPEPVYFTHLGFSL